MDFNLLVAHFVSLVGTLTAVGYAILRGLKWIGGQAVIPLATEAVHRLRTFLEKLEARLEEQTLLLKKLAEDKASTQSGAEHAGHKELKSPQT